MASDRPIRYLDVAEVLACSLQRILQLNPFFVPTTLLMIGHFFSPSLMISSCLTEVYVVMEVSLAYEKNKLIMMVMGVSQ